MSSLIASVLEIQNSDNLHLVKFEFNSQVLTMMSLELSEDIKVGKKVRLSVKPTNVVLAKDISGKLSFANQIKSKIIYIENGKLLSSIDLKVSDIILESIITKESAIRLDLKIDDEVMIMIKASDISIAEVLDV